jgi:cell division protein FtsB
MNIKLHHALIGFLIFVLITSIIRNANSLYQNIPFVNQLEKEYKKEVEKNRHLKLQYAKSLNPNEIEKIIRDKLGFTKDREQVIILPK